MVDHNHDLVADGVLTVADACAFASIGRTCLYEAIGRGELLVVKIGRRTLIPRRALVAWLGSKIQCAAGAIETTNTVVTDLNAERRAKRRGRS